MAKTVETANKTEYYAVTVFSDEGVTSVFFSFRSLMMARKLWTILKMCLLLEWHNAGKSNMVNE